MRRSLWRKPRSQSSSSAASITLCEDPKAAVSLAMSLGLGARNLDDACPALALERSPGGEFLGRARLRHQAEGFHPCLRVGTLERVVQLAGGQVAHREGVSGRHYDVRARNRSD